MKIPFRNQQSIEKIVFEFHFTTLIIIYDCWLTGFSRGSHSCGTLPWIFLMGSELHMMAIKLCGTLFGQIYWKFL